MLLIRRLVCAVWLMAIAVSATAVRPNVSPNNTAHNPAPHTPAQHKIVPPNIVLITLDTTRADRMGFLGSKRGLTPNLDALASQSAIFTHAYAQAPLTPTSHATILTGTYPQFHQVNDFRVPLAKDLPYAPDVLHANGFHTAAFVASMVLDPGIKYAPGFDRGFDAYDAGFHPEAIKRKGRYETVERRGGEVVAHAVAWLNQHPNGPFFMWVHLYDAHDPYDPPEPFRTRYATELYNGEIAYEDWAVGKLLQELKARGLYEGAVIAVMADHGESLGAHGEDTHGVFLYDETIQVPLLIKLPNGAAPEKRIENRVELVDVMPTLLQAVGVAVPAEVQGESLLGMMRTGNNTTADTWRDRPAYAETDYPRAAFGWSALQSLRAGKYLYVQAPRRELYDETADAKAEHNLAPTSTAVADTLAGRLAALLQTTSSHHQAPKASVDPEAEQNLAVLGYVASGNHASRANTADQGVDPKDKIEISNQLHRANAFRQSGRPDEAIPLLKKLLAEDPGMTDTYETLGDCLLDEKQYEEAVPILRKAMELKPDSPLTHFNLAKALMGAGDFAAAVPELEFAVAKVPKFADAHVFLETAYARTDRVPETIRECNIVLEFLPNHFGSYLILGRFLEISGDFAGAIPKLKKAAALEPKAPEPHLFLADAYDRLDRKTDAARERAEADRLAPGGAPSITK